MPSFIAFEGGEGAGKSTQAGLFYQYLLQKGKKVILTREPGGTELAEKLRAILLDNLGVADPLTEALILNAARRDHVETLIKPKMLEKCIVITDRYIGSTIAYQSALKGADIKDIIKLHEFSTNSFYPNITFVFDIDSSIAESRIKQRNGSKTYYDRMPSADKDKIRKCFKELHQYLSCKIIHIDANKSIEDVAAQVIHEYERLFEHGNKLV